MKYLTNIAGVLLGLAFIMSSVTVLFHLVPMPEIPKESPAGMFMGAFGPTGYLTFIKVLELLGGILVMIPRTRNFGLLVLGPIIVNIVAFHVFVTGGDGLFGPMVIAVVVLSLYLLWADRKAWLGLANSK
jgi:putative oxidoreductase